MTKCPKCGAMSGDDWSQCKRSCPMRESNRPLEVRFPDDRSYDDWTKFTAWGDR